MNDKAILEVEKLVHEMTQHLQGLASQGWQTYLMVIQANAIVQLVEALGWVLAFGIISVISYRFSIHAKAVHLTHVQDVLLAIVAGAARWLQPLQAQYFSVEFLSLFYSLIYSMYGIGLQFVDQNYLQHIKL